MNDIIKKLPQDIVLKIAAGEVVERPSSVVKELVENSIDAGATSITVEIQEGGVKYIRVLDNGIGIKENMLAFAFESHSTSKIQDSDDLDQIKTLGFRGEALSSISAVSKIHLSTKHKDSKSGVSIINIGGQIQDIKPSSITVGTNIVVKDLFFNTPARLKFLKKPSVEAGYVSDLILRLILSHPEISFRYINNGKVVYHSVGDGKLESAIARIYDIYTSKNMYEVNYSENGLVLKGYLGILELEKNNRNNQTFFINNRFFKNEIITEALEDGAKGYYTISKYPMCVLNLIVPYDFVDVNVHPNKLEVRFADNNKVYELVKNAILSTVNNIKLKDTLDKPLIQEQSIKNDIVIPEDFSFNSDVVPSYLINSEFENTIDILNDSGSTIEEAQVKWEPEKNNYSDEKSNDSLTTKIEQNSLNIEDDHPKFNIKIIGTVLDSFILVEYMDKLLLIDQHAAQERLNYEKMIKAYDQNNYSQNLITPLLIELNSQEADVIRNYSEQLYKMGFDVSFFDENSIAIRAVPIVLREPMSIKDCFKEIFSNLSGKSLDLSSDIIKEKILQSACKHSIKAGEKLPGVGIVGLVKQLFNSDVAPTCPHGRPIIIQFSKNELYKMFKRIQ